MQHHVDAVCKKCNFHLRHIKSIRPYITKHVCHSLVIAPVVSSLDYCNALLLDIPEYHLTRFQKIHNKAARLVVLTTISEHIKPVLVDLHWLPVRQCIKFKVHICKAMNDLASTYLLELLNKRTINPRLQQLYDDLQLAVPPASKSIDKHCFGTTGPAQWKALPLSLRDAPSLTLFKHKLDSPLPGFIWQCVKNTFL